MLRFRQMKSLQKSASVYANVHDHFKLHRHLTDRQTYLHFRANFPQPCCKHVVRDIRFMVAYFWAKHPRPLGLTRLSACSSVTPGGILLSRPMITAAAFLKFKQHASLRQIEIMCALRREGSISVTAHSLGMSAANVSRTCRRFEQHFDIPIFEKTRNGVVFTPAAKELLAEMEYLDLCIRALSRRICTDV